MSTVIELTADELDDLKRLTQQDDEAAAVRTAVEEYVRYRRRIELKELSGRVEMEDNWMVLEQAELGGGQPQSRTH